ncbi:MAG: glutamate--cysteine ligase, partial [Archangium sp.]
MSHVSRMGLRINRDTFTPEEHERFSGRLLESLEALEVLLGRPGFGEGPGTLGAELELFLVDAAGLPCPVNLELLARTSDPRLTVEMNRYNLECDLQPGPLAGRPFTKQAAECEGALAEVRRAAALVGARVVMAGMLPTLREEDLASGLLTPISRYRVLSATFHRRWQRRQVTLSGEESLTLKWTDVTLGGATSAMQYHLRVDPRAFARTYNAAQLATPLAVAVGAN